LSVQFVQKNVLKFLKFFVLKKTCAQACILMFAGGDGLLDGLCLEALQQVNTAF